MLAQVEKEEKIVNAMTAAEKSNAANMTSGQLLAISRRAGVDANVRLRPQANVAALLTACVQAVSQLVQTFSMSRAQLLILADMKEQGLAIPSDPKDLQALLGQHAERMIREAQMRPIDRGVRLHASFFPASSSAGTHAVPFFLLRSRPSRIAFVASVHTRSPMSPYLP